MISMENVAPSLISFSTVGFIVIFGTATFIPMVYELTILRKNESVKLLRRYPYRLISRLGTTISICILMVCSLLFAIIGLLSLIYLLFENELIIKSAIVLSILTVLILIIYIILVLIFALSYKEQEVDQIAEYTAHELNNKTKG